MSISDDFDHYGIDDDDQPSAARCRRCGSEHVMWLEGKLCNLAGYPHVCNVKTLHKKSMDDFEDESV